MDTISTIGYLVQHLSAVMARQSDQLLLEQLGIGFSQFKILMVLQSNPDIQQKQIAETLGQTEASISRQIKLLTQKGLLATRLRPENKREHLTSLTPRGVRFADEAMRIIRKYQALVLEGVSDKSKQQLVDLLSDVHIRACPQGDAADHLRIG